AQPNRINSCISNRFSSGLDKWWYILSNQCSSRYEGMRTDFTELMYSDHACKDDIVSNRNMSRQCTGIGEDTVVAHETIMCNMTICLNKAIFPNYGLVSIFCTPIDGDTLSNCCVVSDLGRCNLSFKL